MIKGMSRRSRLSSEDLLEIKALYARGVSRLEISSLFSLRGVVINPATIYYHLGLRKKRKCHVKSYLDYVREDCSRRGVPYQNPRGRERRLWS